MDPLSFAGWLIAYRVRRASTGIAGPGKAPAAPAKIKSRLAANTDHLDLLGIPDVLVPVKFILNPLRPVNYAPIRSIRSFVHVSPLRPSRTRTDRVPAYRPGRTA